MYQDSYQLMMDGSFEEYSGTFPKAGMSRSGVLYRLPTWGRRTSESASSSWPTPNTLDGNKARPPRLKKDQPRNPNTPGSYWGDLKDRVMWPTPVGDDTGHRSQQYSQGGTALSMTVGGQLNPTWVEWLMGFPLGWTDLEGSATP